MILDEVELVMLTIAGLVMHIVDQAEFLLVVLFPKPIMVPMFSIYVSRIELVIKDLGVEIIILIR